MDIGNVIVSWLHELATVLWIGALMLNALVLTPAMSAIAPLERHRLTITTIKRFTIIAIVCVLVLIGTGFGLAEKRLGPDFLSLVLSTTYGRVMLAKLFVMLSMIVIGGIIGFVLEPRMRALPHLSTREQEPPGATTTAASFELVSLQRRLNILGIVEMSLGILVLLLAAILPEIVPRLE